MLAISGCRMEYTAAILGDQPSVNYRPSSAALDNLLHSKGKILKTKLEVLAAEILQRLNLRDINVTRIGHDQTMLGDIVNALTRQANYQQREHREKVPLYAKQFDLENERRAQDVECWRDVVMVMRDFLGIWEAHEQARSRAIFLNHVGTGLEEHL